MLWVGLWLSCLAVVGFGPAKAEPSFDVGRQDVATTWERTLPQLALTDLAKKYGRNSTAGLSSLLLSGASTANADEAAAAEVFTAERDSILKALHDVSQSGGDMDGLINRTEKLFRDTLAKYHAKTPQLKQLLAANAANSAAKFGRPSNTAGPQSFLEVESGVVATSMEGACEVCVYVLENKQMRQPFLCRGLKAAQYQQVCVSVLVSLMWWLENEVYWVNYGCQRQNGYVLALRCLLLHLSSDWSSLFLTLWGNVRTHILVFGL